MALPIVQAPIEQPVLNVKLLFPAIPIPRECRTTPNLHCYIIQDSGLRVILRHGRMVANVKFAVLVLCRFETVRMAPGLKSAKMRSNEPDVIEQRDHHRAGPCGLILAIELGRRGIGAVVLEEKISPLRFPAANATQARTMEHYRRLGFADKVRAQGLPSDYPTDIAYFTRLTSMNWRVLDCRRRDRPRI